MGRSCQIEVPWLEGFVVSGNRTTVWKRKMSEFAPLVWIKSIFWAPSKSLSSKVWVTSVCIVEISSISCLILEMALAYLVPFVQTEEPVQCVCMYVCVWLPVITALMEILHGSQLSISSLGDCCDSPLLNSKAWRNELICSTLQLESQC